MNVSLECSAKLDPADEIAIERRLYLAGFDVLNRARLAQEMRVEFSPAITIDAIDQRGRIVSVTGFEAPSLAGEASTARFLLYFSLYSRPPTSREAPLEKSLENIATDIPMCSIDKVERHTNPASMEWLHRDISEKTHGWFQQAEQMAPKSEALRQH